ncbi:MAG: enoyl-CoA hydratase [Hydrocarboniphaga sp.]|uniref:enoyl-CoA hydratase-related protein n=1 Tax=Hydrocarboniphaga sp. TaxID=2033016 RepID=UPI0026354266|nr:enoyl-CoA hydratase-related protein [Hydrocarboniphaga sp.]MDB5970163.1 enoyl-CoA hydratase [Hydrocarboniphaga sp.]
MAAPETTAVIVGIGEFVDRPERAADALEPVALMAQALRAADADSGGTLLQQVESLELIGLVSWRYRDPVNLLCERLGIQPARRVNASMGGETPIRLIHEAAVRISQGELTTAAIVGGEAMHAVTRSRKEGVKPAWTPLASKQDAVRFPSSSFETSPIARQIGVTDPAQIYPLYEMATQAAWQQSPVEAQRESAQLWAQFAGVAADNTHAWIRSAPSADAIATVSEQNRLINWPYPKFMVANPMVNQAAAVIVTSLAQARKAGIPENRLIHIWGGASAKEPEDYLKRDRYDRSSAQSAVLKKVVDMVGGDARRFDRLELYSCFPVVPKMALRTLGLDPKQHAPTVTGGLSFFGGPLNNYMTHAVCAMVRTLREHPSEIGLLYGQGGFVNKHHALIVSTQPPETALAADYSVQDVADQNRDIVPPLADAGYHGPATVETYTILYGRDGEPLQGVVVARNPAGERVMARVPTRDAASLQLLASNERSAVGSEGQVRIDTFNLPVWEAGAAPRDRQRIERQFCKVEREGPLTIVTINRPEAMNSLHPDSNAELAEIFDEFESDSEQWVAIITGAGDRAFSSGNDLKYMAKAMACGASIEPPAKGFAGLTNRHSLNKPVIAAVNGIAMGGGFEIALACDLIIASSNAKFALPEPKVGVAAVAGGLLRLPQQIGIKRAMSLILTGRSVSAEEGLELGFVNQVTAPENLMQEARRWAGEIAACSPMSIRASKEIVQRGLDEPTLAIAYENQMTYPAARALFRSSDFREGPMAFAQKRAPRWKSE